jgi:hypothetical protein
MEFAENSDRLMTYDSSNTALAKADNFIVFTYSLENNILSRIFNVPCRFNNIFVMEAGKHNQFSFRPVFFMTQYLGDEKKCQNLPLFYYIQIWCF